MPKYVALKDPGLSFFSGLLNSMDFQDSDSDNESDKPDSPQ